MRPRSTVPREVARSAPRRGRRVDDGVPGPRGELRSRRHGRRGRRVRRGRRRAGSRASPVRWARRSRKARRHRRTRAPSHDMPRTSVAGRTRRSGRSSPPERVPSRGSPGARVRTRRLCNPGSVQRVGQLHDVRFLFAAHLRDARRTGLHAAGLRDRTGAVQRLELADVRGARHRLRTTTTACATNALCNADSGTCNAPACASPGQHRCNGAEARCLQLRPHRLDRGDDVHPARLPCDADGGQCTAAACAPGAYRCNGAELRGVPATRPATATRWPCRPARPKDLSRTRRPGQCDYARLQGLCLDTQWRRTSSSNDGPGQELDDDADVPSGGARRREGASSAFCPGLGPH